MTRRVFYSFQYKPDNWRAAEVRNIGSIEGNRPAKDNAWEAVKQGGYRAIVRWIAKQMYGRSCTVVLVGTNTAGRKWINYEIVKSWNEGMGVVGIRVHGLKNMKGRTSLCGESPFDYAGRGKLKSIVKCYDPSGRSSKEKYEWISKNLACVVEEAIEIRVKYPIRRHTS